MRLLVTGGSSFVGAWVCRVAADRGHEVIALHHGTPLQLNGLSPRRVDLRRPRDVAGLRALAPDVVLHLACRIRAPANKGGTASQAAALVNRAMMDAVLSLERPVLYASSTVVHWDRATPYGESRREDEARLRASGLPWAILRPSAPYGPRLLGHQPRHRESFDTLVKLVRSSPVVPIIGDGRYRRQPLHVADLAAAALALVEGQRWGQAFDLGGADALEFDEIVRTIARAAHRRVALLHLPKALFIKLAARSADFDPDLIAAVDQDEVADPAPLEAATGLRMRSFAQGVGDLL